MFWRILVPLDGSRNAERALAWLAEYAGPSKASVVLIRVLPPTQLGKEGAVSLAEARAYLSKIGLTLANHGIAAKILVRSGAAAPAIVQAAQQERCDVIIMPTRGGSKVQRWLVGGVTEQVMRLSAVPVLVIRSRVPVAAQGVVHRVLLPLDGSKHSESALPWAENLARFHGATVVLFHSAEAAGRRREDAFDAFVRRTKYAADRMRQRGTRTILKVTSGDAAENILAAARPKDVIVMTTHGFGGVKRWILGSVAEKVIHEAGVPVLIFKGPARARAVALPVG